MLLRDPAEIPAPVAIALADFCRRADRPSSADEVRQALARLSPDEDRAVLALCRGEPPARPLSPHAVIDVARGLPAAEAARREEAGAYEGIALEAAEEAASVRAAAPTFAQQVEAAAEEQARPFAATDDEQRARLRDAVARARGDLEKAADELGLEDAAALRRLAGKLGVLEELAAAAPAPRKEAEGAREKAPKKKKKDLLAAGPIRRTKAEAEALRAAREAAPEPEEEAAPAPRPGRTPAAPQFGRFVTGQAVRRPWAELEGAAGKDVLEGLVAELRGNRRQLVDRLGTLYARADGRPVAEGDLDRLLARHGLATWFGQVEGENLKILLRQSRGFLPPVARALGLEPRELSSLLRRHHLEDDVRELKERTREEARAERPLPERILLAAEKEEQLRDASVLDELDSRNLDELRPAIEAVAGEGASQEPTVVVELARRRLEIEPRVWRKALRRYRLAHLAAEILGVPPPEEPKASRTSGAPVEREAPARSNLPVRQRFGAPRREVQITRVGGAGGGEPPARRFASRPAPGGERPQRRFGEGGGRPFPQRPAEGGERPQRRFGEGGGRPFPPRPAEGGERPPRRFGEGGGRPFPQRPAEGGERPQRRFGQGGGRPFPPRPAEGGERPPRRFGEGGGRPFPPRPAEGGERPPRRFGQGGGRPFPPRPAEGGERPQRRFGAPGADRPPRRFGAQAPAGEGGARPSRRAEGSERPPRRFGGDAPRPPRGPGAENRPPRRFGAAAPRRPEGPGTGSRPPGRAGGPRPPRGGPGGGKRRG